MFVLVVILVFLRRDVMRKRGLCCRPVSVCPFVRPFCLSRWCIVSTWRNTSSNFFSARLPIILVFYPPAPVPNSKGNSFNVGEKHGWAGKFCDFRLKSPFISEKVQAIGPWLL